MASQHLSIRLPQETIDRLDRLSNQSDGTRSETARTFIEEGLRMMDHPGIVFRPGPTGRRAGLARGPDVWEIVSAIHVLTGHVDDPVAVLADQIRLSAYEIQLALTYYEAFTDEVDQRIALNHAALAGLEAAWMREQRFIQQ